MSALRSGFLCLVAGLGLLGCACYLFPGLAVGLGLDFRDLKDAVRTLQEAGVRSEELRAEEDATLSRIAARQKVVAAVIAGRLTLREAAARFRRLDEAWPSFNREQFRLAQPGATDDERYLYAVMECVRQELKAQPDAGQDLLRCLAAETGTSQEGDLRARTGGCICSADTPAAAPARAAGR